MFGFHAAFVDCDDLAFRLTFADKADKSAEHSFIMDRAEELREVAVPDMRNVYIERDDQGWGGYGGIERVVLERDSLTLHLGPRMATKMGEHDQIRVNFTLNDADFRHLHYVLAQIMRGYEQQLESRA